MPERIKCLIIFFVFLLVSIFLVAQASAQPVALIAAFFTEKPCNTMLPGEVVFHSHSTGSPQKIVWTVTCPDGTIIVSEDKSPKFNLLLLGDYQVSLKVSRVVNEIAECDTLVIPGYAKVISDPLKLHPPQSLEEK